MASCPTKVRNLVDAAVAADARRLVVESIPFSTPPDGAAAVAEMERMAESSGLEAVILRFGYFWGPGMWHDAAEAGETFVHLREAAAQAGRPHGVASRDLDALAAFTRAAERYQRTAGPGSDKWSRDRARRSHNRP